MDSKLWSRLPTEIQEHLLSFLSVPVLCRFQTVCKRWDSLILSPQFRALCNKNGNARDFVLGRYAVRIPGQPKFCKSLGWRLLDVKEKKWYFIKEVHQDCFESRSLAMDGGLACAYCLDRRIDHSEEVRVIVSNPIAKVSTRLPASPFDDPPTSSTGERLPFSRRVPSVMNMVVDHITQEYQIFAMRCALHERAQGPCLTVYESARRSWRLSSTNLARLTGIRTTILVRSTIFSQGLLYVLITNRTEQSGGRIGERWHLWSYNPMEDSWKNTGASKTSRLPTVLVHPQLVVTDNRLFLAAWFTVQHLPDHLRPSPVKKFYLIELFLVPEQLVPVASCRILFHLPESRMAEIFEPEDHEETPVGRQFDSTDLPYSSAHSPDIAVFSIGKSIGLIARASGVSMKIDTVNCTWDAWWVFEWFPCYHELWYGQRGNLVLHPGMFSQFSRRRLPGLTYLSDDDSSDE